LKDRPLSGRPSFLSHIQKAELEHILQNNPSQYDYNTSIWTGAIVNFEKWCDDIDCQKKIWQKRTYLHSLDFSFQKGKGYFPETEGRTEKLDELNCR